MFLTCPYIDQANSYPVRDQRHCLRLGNLSYAILRYLKAMRIAAQHSTVRVLRFISDLQMTSLCLLKPSHSPRRVNRRT